MHLYCKILAIVSILIFAQVGEGFVPRPTSMVKSSSPIQISGFQRTSHNLNTSLLMAPKDPDSNKGTNQVDWIGIAGMFVNPLNPYAWFVYFFVGIYLYGYLQQGTGN